MLELSEKYLNDHNNPHIKLELQTTTTTKLFLPKTNNLVDRACVDKSLINLKTVLEHTRVDRRCARSQAIWLENDNLSKVTKPIGPLIANLGYQNKNGKFLLPEETLFMLECNKLELSNSDNKSISIEEAYNLILINETDLLKYRVYKKLVGQGYKLFKQIKNNKRKLDNSNENEIEAKISKVTTTTIKIKEEDNEIMKVFQKLKENSPKTFNNKSLKFVEIKPDYFGYFPNNNNFNKNQPDFNLYICNEKQSNINNLNINRNNLDNIFAICSDNNISFYRFNQINIPTNLSNN